MNESIWSKEIRIPERKKLDKNIETEVAVIGAGLSGIMIAHRLQRAGKKVVVLEADRIASGQTKNTTAKITAQHGLIYSKLADNFGIDTARGYAMSNMRAIDWYRKFINENNISCSFEEQDAYLYTEREPQILKKEAEICKDLGLETEFTKRTDLPFSVAGTVRMGGQAQFSPLEFISAIIPELRIYEKTRVKSIRDKMIYCDGAIVQAQHIVFACHYPFVNFPGMYFLRMHQERSYVIALEDAQMLDGMYLGIDESGYSFRRYGDLMLLGGGKHRTGENSAGGKYDLLRQAAQRFFPRAREVAHWSAQDCITADGIPYIGKFSCGRPDWYIATGFGKWGMTTSCVAAEIITDQICEKENSYADIFSPSRFSSKAALGIAGEGKQAVKGLICRNLTIPREKLTDIPVGQGGIVKHNGDRVGVYRESEDKSYCVSVKCPHLGCRLEWNPDEKSWDCPCHGSRFDFLGRLIDNPAQTNLLGKR